MSRRPLVSLYCVVHGPIYERYADQMWAGARELFLPDCCEYVQLPGETGWPHASAARYKILLDHLHEIAGEWIFQIDADMLVENPVGREILGDGLTVTTHPGFPPGSDPDTCPYDRDPDSGAYVPYGTGSRYYPGCFVGGRREAFLTMCETVSDRIAADEARGYSPTWYEESYLNRYLIETPPVVELDRRYCYWDHWGPGEPGERILTHLDKTAAEFAERGH